MLGAVAVTVEGAVRGSCGAGRLKQAANARPEGIDIDMSVVRGYVAENGNWRSEMGTMVELEDGALATAEDYARTHAISLTAAVAELIRKGGGTRVPFKQVDGVWVLDLAADARIVTARQVRQLLDAS